jgi:hypothetical protein
MKRLRTLVDKGWANREYATAYLERFLGKNLHAAAQATQAPRKVVQVLPDAWRVADDDGHRGRAEGWHVESFDDSQWAVVSAYARTLSSQGRNTATVIWYRNSFVVPAKHGRLAMAFVEVDGSAEVFFNGHKVDAIEDKADTAGNPIRPRTFFEVDLANVCRPGKNVLAVRVDSRALTELFLGGILRPVVLIEGPG